MVNFNFYYNYLQNLINHEYSLCILIRIIITFTRLISLLGNSDLLKSFYLCILSVLKIRNVIM
jgi:hypothetical protein